MSPKKGPVFHRKYIWLQQNWFFQGTFVAPSIFQAQKIDQISPKLARWSHAWFKASHGCLDAYRFEKTLLSLTRMDQWMQSFPSHSWWKSRYYITCLSKKNSHIWIPTFYSLYSPHELFKKKACLQGLPPTSTSTVLWSLPWVQVVDGAMPCISMPWRCRPAKMKRCMELRLVGCSLGRWRLPTFWWWALQL